MSSFVRQKVKILPQNLAKILNFVSVSPSENKASSAVRNYNCC